MLAAAALASWLCVAPLATTAGLLLPPATTSSHALRRGTGATTIALRSQNYDRDSGYGRFRKRGDDENLFRGRGATNAEGRRQDRQYGYGDDTDEESYRLAREMAARRGLDVRDDRGSARGRGGGPTEPGYGATDFRPRPPPSVPGDKYDDLYEVIVTRESQRGGGGGNANGGDNRWGSRDEARGRTLKDMVDRSGDAPRRGAGTPYGSNFVGRAGGEPPSGNGGSRYRQYPMPPAPPREDPRAMTRQQWGTNDRMDGGNGGWREGPASSGRSVVDEARYNIDRMQGMQNNQPMRPGERRPPPTTPPMQPQYSDSQANQVYQQLNQRQRQAPPQQQQPPIPPPMARPPSNFNYGRNAYQSMPLRSMSPPLSELANWVDPPPTAFEQSRSMGQPMGRPQRPPPGKFQQPSFGKAPYGRPPYGGPYPPPQTMRPPTSVPLSQLAVQPNIEPVDRATGSSGNPSAQTSKLPFAQLDPSDFRRPYEEQAGQSSERNPMQTGDGATNPGPRPGVASMQSMGFRQRQRRQQQRPPPQQQQHPGIGPTSNSGRPMPFQQIPQSDFRQPYQEQQQPPQTGARPGGPGDFDPRGGPFQGGPPPPGFDRPPPPGMFGEDDPMFLSPFAVPPMMGMPPPGGGPPPNQPTSSGIQKEEGVKVPKDPFAERQKRSDRGKSESKGDVKVPKDPFAERLEQQQQQQQQRPRWQPPSQRGEEQSRSDEEKRPKDPFSERQQREGQERRPAEPRRPVEPRRQSTMGPNGSGSAGNQMNMPKDPFAERRIDGRPRQSTSMGGRVPNEPSIGNSRNLRQQSQGSGFRQQSFGQDGNAPNGGPSLGRDPRDGMSSSSFGESMSYEEYSRYFDDAPGKDKGR